MGSAQHSRTCPTCGCASALSRFDVAVRGDDGAERCFFGLPGAVCPRCHRLLLDRETPALFRFEEADIAFAIQSDASLGESREVDAA